MHTYTCYIYTCTHTNLNSFTLCSHKSYGSIAESGYKLITSAMNSPKIDLYSSVMLSFTSWHLTYSFLRHCPKHRIYIFGPQRSANCCTACCAGVNFYTGFPRPPEIPGYPGNNLKFENE